MPYFQVPDCDASATKSIALGAKGMIPPQDIPGTGDSPSFKIRRARCSLCLPSKRNAARFSARGRARLALLPRARPHSSCPRVPASEGPQTPAAGRWYKGNTHTHTLNSDGDSTPDDVVRWYREHGYQFLVLTDHNFLTTVTPNALHGADEQFLVVKGEEVTRHVRRQALHINGLDVQRAGRAPGRDVGV